MTPADALRLWHSIPVTGSLGASLAEFLRRADARSSGIAAAARALIVAVEERHATLPWPQKYGVPYGAVNDLRAALDATDSIAARASTAGAAAAFGEENR